MSNTIHESDAGCWLDGNQGWHNPYRAIYRAQQWGFTVTADDEEVIELYKRWHGGDMSAEEQKATDWAIEAVSGQGGLCDKATEYLDSIAPEGFAFHWDAGELSLLCLCQIEGTEENTELLKSRNYYCGRCAARYDS